MEIQEILQELEFNKDRTFPRVALTQAIAKREEIIPELLNILQYAKENIEELMEEEGYMAHIYAMFLLAQFREKRAYPLIADFFSIPGEITLDFTGDVVTEDLGSILASASCGDTSLIKALIENRAANEYVRSAGIRALVTLYACGELAREDLMSYFQSLLRGKLEREFSQVWNGLVARCTDVYPEEVYADIKQAYNDDLVEPFYIGFEDVEERLSRGKENVLANLSRRYTLITDTIKAMEWWACFRKPEDRRKSKGNFSKMLKDMQKR